MHFRTRNNVIQVIRTTYDPDTRKGKNAIVGRMNKLNPVISDELREALSADEIRETETWLAGRSRITSLQNELSARSLPDAIEKAAAWLSTADDPDAAKLIYADILQAWQTLRRVAKKQELSDA